MQVESLVMRQPTLDRGVLVAAVVVDNQMSLKLFGCVALDQAQETEELLMPMMRPALRHNLPVGNVQRRETASWFHGGHNRE